MLLMLQLIASQAAFLPPDHGVSKVAEAEKEDDGGVTLALTFVGLATVYITSTFTPTQLQGSCLRF